MERLEPSTTQVNAALLYCQENRVNIFGPVRQISRVFIGKMSLIPREKKSFRAKVNENVKSSSFALKTFLGKTKENFLSRIA